MELLRWMKVFIIATIFIGVATEFWAAGYVLDWSWRYVTNNQFRAAGARATVPLVLSAGAIFGLIVILVSIAFFNWRGKGGDSTPEAH